MNDLKIEAATTAAKVTPPLTVTVTAWFGLIDWGIVSLIVALVYSVLSIYWGWRRHRRAEADFQRKREEREQQAREEGCSDEAQ